MTAETSEIQGSASQSDIGGDVQPVKRQLVDGFTRSRDGKTIHRTDCQVRGDRVPWQWADDKTDHKVAWTILETPWLRPCKRCMGGLADAL